MAAASGKVAIRATYRGTGKGGFILACQPTGETFAMDAIYLVLVKRAGPDRRTLGHGRHHRHRGPA